jgi:hypothetical protein
MQIDEARKKAGLRPGEAAGKIGGPPDREGLIDFLIGVAGAIALMVAYFILIAVVH